MARTQQKSIAFVISQCFASESPRHWGSTERKTHPFLVGSSLRASGGRTPELFLMNKLSEPGKKQIHSTNTYWAKTWVRMKNKTDNSLLLIPAILEQSSANFCIKDQALWSMRFPYNRSLLALWHESGMDNTDTSRQVLYTWASLSNTEIWTLRGFHRSLNMSFLFFSTFKNVETILNLLAHTKLGSRLDLARSHSWSTCVLG